MSWTKRNVMNERELQVRPFLLAGMWKQESLQAVFPETTFLFVLRDSVTLKVTEL